MSIGRKLTAVKLSLNVSIDYEIVTWKRRAKSMSFHKLLSTTAALVLVSLAACSGESGESGEAGGNSSAVAELTSRALTPPDPVLAAIYNRSCRNCHTIAATGAPLTGDSAAWASRMTRGRKTLVENVVNGVGAMPPFGMCRSVRTRSGLVFSMRAIASVASAASPTIWKFSPRSSLIPDRQME